MEKKARIKTPSHQAFTMFRCNMSTDNAICVTAAAKEAEPSPPFKWVRQVSPRRKMQQIS